MFDLLCHKLRQLYRVSEQGGKSKPADMSAREDSQSKDRPLTAEVAKLGGLEPLAAKGKGRGNGGVATGANATVQGGSSNSSGSGAKRESPDPERGGREARRRTAQ